LSWRLWLRILFGRMGCVSSGKRNLPSGKQTELWKLTMLLMGKSTINGHVQSLFVCWPFRVPRNQEWHGMTLQAGELTRNPLRSHKAK
jgi:hypothetical protein